MTVSLRLAFDFWLVLSFVDQTCGYSLGNSSSSALSGKRSETEPFGVEDASNPSSVTSARMRRAVRFWKACDARNLSSFKFTAHKRLFQESGSFRL